VVKGSGQSAGGRERSTRANPPPFSPSPRAGGAYVPTFFVGM
jgi:hypothetical protein